MSRHLINFKVTLLGQIYVRVTCSGISASSKVSTPVNHAPRKRPTRGQQQTPLSTIPKIFGSSYMNLYCGRFENKRPLQRNWRGQLGRRIIRKQRIYRTIDLSMCWIILSRRGIRIFKMRWRIWMMRSRCCFYFRIYLLSIRSIQRQSRTVNGCAPSFNIMWFDPRVYGNVFCR